MRPWIRLRTNVEGNSANYPEIKLTLYKADYTVLQRAFGIPTRHNALEVYTEENIHFSKHRHAEYGPAIAMVDKYIGGKLAVQSWRGPIYIQTTTDDLDLETEALRELLHAPDAEATYITHEEMMEHIHNNFGI